MSSGQTIVEKIATRHAVDLPPGRRVYAGDFVNIRPRHVMTHDNTSAVMAKFRTITGADGTIADPRQPVFAIDHDIQNTAPENLAKYERIEAFARRHGIDFYPPGTGISHQVMVEKGYVTPGGMVVGSDSHSNLYGAANALGTPVVRTDAACIWATGQTWWQVPPVARVNLTGALQPGVVGKDVIIALCGVFNHDEVLNMAVEFHGDGVGCLSMDQRMTVANMTTEWGALAGVFPFDAVLRAYFADRPDADRGHVDADDDASYAVELTLDLSTVIPHVSGPDHVKVMHALPEIEKQRIRIHKAYLLSCVNARLEDLAEAARILNGRKVADGVEFYVAAASRQVQEQAEALGYWQVLREAGADMLPSGCGPCIGLGRGTLEPGEVCISATNRNFKGRMGSRDAQAYLASPAVVAASAAAGYICAPTPFADTKPKFSIKVSAARHRSPAAAILDGFPATITGRTLLLPVDNLNTDGIYSGKLTYRDDVTEQQMADAAFANYDPEFNAVARAGDIVVAGRNFGTGSSREQAATCLAHRGLACVVAASFSQTYKRNAFNNGFLVIDSPAVYDALHAMLAGGATIPGPEITLDFENSCARLEGRALPISPLSTVAQELIVAGGAERLVRNRLSTVE
jgi:homoaconitate hydratase